MKNKICIKEYGVDLKIGDEYRRGFVERKLNKKTRKYEFFLNWMDNNYHVTSCIFCRGTGLDLCGDVVEKINNV